MARPPVTPVEPSALDMKTLRLLTNYEQIWPLFVTLTFALIRKGHTKLGVKMIWETMRYQYLKSARLDGDVYHLNNVYTASISRIWQATYPQFADVFTTRKRPTECRKAA